MKSVIVTGLLILALLMLVEPAQAITVGPNVDITMFNDLGSRQQVEPTIAVHPLKPEIIVAGAQDLRLVALGGHRWHGYYRSTNAGQTWSVNLLPGFPGDNSPEGLSSPLLGFDLTTDPVLAFDRHGNVYYTGIAVELTSDGNIDFSSLRAFVAKYINDGADYAGVTVIPHLIADKQWIAVDNTGGPNDGNVYIVFDIAGAHVVFTRSTDGGITFSPPIGVPGGGILPGLAVDSNGNIFVSAIDLSLRRILVSRSAAAGMTFERPVTVAEVEAVPSPLPGTFFRAFTIPQIAANENGVYVVWDDFGTGDANVLFSRSTDGGTTWSSPITVNDNTSNHQFFPTISVSPGRIHVAWYDSRLDDGGFIANLDVFYSQSTDGGVSFSANIRVTDVSFNPNLVPRSDPPGTFFAFIGDYIHIAASPLAAHPIWADNRNACNVSDPMFGCVDQDVFTAALTF